MHTLPENNKAIPFLTGYQIEELSRGPLPLDLKRDGFTISRTSSADSGQFDIMVSEENKDIVADGNAFLYKNISSEWFIGIPKVDDAKSFHFPSFYKYWDFMWRGQEMPGHIDTEKKNYGVAVFAGNYSEYADGELANEKIELMHKLSMYIPVYTNIEMEKKNVPRWSKIIYVDININRNAIRDFRDAKHNFISQYTHNLCFEDSVKDGYLTEQIFDSLANGCVPIYKGDPNIEKWISKKYFIDAQGKTAEGIAHEIKTRRDLIERINEKKTGCIKVQLKEMRKMLRLFEGNIVKNRKKRHSRTETTSPHTNNNDRPVFFNVFSMREMAQNPLGCGLSKEGFTFTSIFINTPGHFDIFYSGENRRYDTTPRIFTYDNVSSEWFIGIPKIDSPKAFHFPLLYMYWDFIENGYEKPVHVENKIFGVSFVSSHIATDKNWTKTDLTNERFNLIHQLSLFIPVFANSALKYLSPEWSKVTYIEVPRHSGGIFERILWRRIRI